LIKIVVVNVAQMKVFKKMGEFLWLFGDEYSFIFRIGMRLLDIQKQHCKQYKLLEKRTEIEMINNPQLYKAMLFTGLLYTILVKNLHCHLSR